MLMYRTWQIDDRPTFLLDEKFIGDYFGKRDDAYTDLATVNLELSTTNDKLVKFKKDNRVWTELVDLHDTVGKLRSRIQRDGTSNKWPSLETDDIYYNGKRLENFEPLPEVINDDKEPTFEFRYSNSYSKDEIKVRLAFKDELLGDEKGSLVFILRANYTISTFKQMIAGQEGIPIEDQEIYFLTTDGSVNIKNEDDTKQLWEYMDQRQDPRSPLDGESRRNRATFISKSHFDRSGKETWEYTHWNDTWVRVL